MLLNVYKHATLPAFYFKMKPIDYTRTVFSFLILISIVINFVLSDSLWGGASVSPKPCVGEQKYNYIPRNTTK